MAGAELVKNPNQGLLVKCGTKFPNDANKAKAEYIKIRVEQLKAELAEHLKQVAIKEEQERERVAKREEQERERASIKEEQERERVELERYEREVLEFESNNLPNNHILAWFILYLSHHFS